MIDKSELGISLNEQWIPKTILMNQLRSIG